MFFILLIKFHFTLTAVYKAMRVQIIIRLTLNKKTAYNSVYNYIAMLKNTQGGNRR